MNHHLLVVYNLPKFRAEEFDLSFLVTSRHRRLQLPLSEQFSAIDRDRVRDLDSEQHLVPVRSRTENDIGYACSGSE